MVVTETVQYTVQRKIANLADNGMSVFRGLLFGSFFAYRHRTYNKIPAVGVYIVRKVRNVYNFTLYSVLIGKRKHVGYAVYTAIIRI